MGKQWVKGAKKVKLEPRSQQEIANEYTQLCSKVGHARYQIELLTQDLTKNLDRMAQLNIEASERKTLDDKKVADQTPVQTQEVANG